MLARAASVVLALWLMVSVFVWEHDPQESMVVGLYWSWIFAVLAAGAFVIPALRFGSAALGAVLAVYAVLGHHAARFTRWHDFIIGLAFVALAAVPSRPLLRHEIRPERHVST